MKLFRHKKNKYWLLLGFVFCFVVFGFGILSTEVFAQADTFGLEQVEGEIALTGGDIRVTIANIIRAILGLLGIIAVLIVLYGGFVYMTSAGNEEKISRAKKILINGVIGLVIILSAFTIVQFVINRLTEAFQSGDGGDDIPTSVCDIASPDYDALLCQTLCTANPNLSVCKDLAFYVKSITPSTPGADVTGMNNIVVRVLFSHPLASDTDLATVLTIENSSGGQLVPLTIVQKAEGYGLEVVYGNDDGHIPLENYTIEVNEDIVDAQGNGLIGDYGFGGLSFPLVAEVNVDQVFDDTVPPEIGDISINGQVDVGTVLYKGDVYTIDTSVADVTQVAAFGGVGLVHISIKETNTGTLIEEYFDAPLIEDGSSVVFNFSYTSLISSKYKSLTQYTVEIEALDIDHKSSVVGTSFTVYGAHCNNGVQDVDDGETDIDIGGSCGGGGGDSCSTDTDCAGGLTCGIDNVCAAYPIIGNVDPMDGADGNWITVSGVHFGDIEGAVQFAVDSNNNESYEDGEWVDAVIPECTVPGANSWNNTYVIAEVPSGFTPGSLSSIRIVPDQEPNPSLAKIIDGSAEFDGVDGTISFAEGPTYIAGDTHDFSLSTWMMSAAVDGTYVISSGGLNDNNGWVLFIQDQTLYIQVSEPGGSLRAEAPFPASLSGEASHVAVVYDVSADSLILYLNGQSYEATSGDLLSPSRGNYLNIGGERSIGEAHYFDGFVDEFALYNTALSPAAVGAHYSIGLSGSAVQYHQQVVLNNPVGYFHLNELQGTTAINEVSVGPNGIYENGASVIIQGIFQNRSHAILINGEPTLADLTTNHIGPKPGTKEGQFEHNSTIRPGLCSVTTAEQTILEPEEGGDTVIIPSGATAAPAGVALEAAGVGFGVDGEVSFGGIVNAPVSAWSESLIGTEVPENMTPGTVAVVVQAGGESSNGVPFTIMADAAPVDAPIISSIDPAASTPESFITIHGDGFGTSGDVFIADSPEHVKTCFESDPLEQDGSCHKLNVSALPDYCGDTWGNTQVIAEIPAGTPVGTYSLLLQNVFSLTTDGEDSLEVVGGLPRPSICRLDPESGPAPLPDEADALHIRGVHFSASPEVYFSTKGTVINNLSTWLSSLFNTVFGDPVIEDRNDTEVRTLIPVGEAGYSMLEGSGQIKIQSKNVLSNSIAYTVSDCRDQAGGAPSGYQCCATGPDAGSLVPNTFACEGEIRDAGYVWRFTTGLIPQIPEVVEECDEIDLTSTQLDEEIDPPSPSPFGDRTGGDSVCINAELSVRFTMEMDSGSFAGNVALYTCGTGSAPDCDNKQPASVQPSYSAKRLVIRSSPALPALKSNTWYRVELLENIQSKEFLVEFGDEIEKNQFLKKTSPCGDGTAYCFEFKTGDGFLCKLEAVGIHPSVFTTPILGLLHSPVYSAEDEDTLYYSLWGKTNQSCISINVDGHGWDWKTSDEKASVELAPDLPDITDSRATAEALEHTAPESVEITASADIQTDADGTTNLFIGTSDLYIDLADPVVIYREPECSASCINASIQADFNRHMAIETYDDGFHLYECGNLQDPNCTDTYEILLSPGEFELSSEFSLVVQPSSFLKPNTRYKVVLTEDIKSLGRLNPPILGKGLVPTEWFFKTKDDTEPCASNEVRVVPDPFTAYEIGEKTTYLAQPYSSPNECNPNGQALSPYSETYSWNTDDSDVAKVTNFNTSYGSADVCTNTCLPKGSNVPNSVSAEDLVLCGNGVVDTGEDCDIGILGTAGTDCTLNCLRPGNTTATCGNAFIDEFDGELCDPADPETGIFCTDDCLLLGVAAETEAGACGNGILEFNESCDTGLTLAQALSQGLSVNASKVGCTNECLHVGSTPVAYWCDIYPNLGGCDTSFSICGNGFLERGEECEVGENGATEETCSDRCLLQDVCSTPLAECSPADEGCNSDCTLAGSSLMYSEPSVCGDGTLGIGEFVGGYSCEGGVADPSAGSGPVQVVTAVGESVSAQDDEDEQKTLVNASLIDDSTISGSGDYTLQCGFTEFTVGVEGGALPIQPGNCEFLPAQTCLDSVSDCGYYQVTTQSDGKQRYNFSSKLGYCFTGLTIPLNLDASNLDADPAVVQRFSCDVDVDCQDFSLFSGVNVRMDGFTEFTDYSPTEFEDYFNQSGGSFGCIVPGGSVLSEQQCVGVTIPEDTGINNFIYNDCSQNSDNSLGVASNSCCLSRPVRTDEYPEDGAGFGGEEKVCRNTYIEATFESEIKSDTISESILLVTGHEDPNYDCTLEGGQNSTEFVKSSLIAFASENNSTGFWQNVWQKVKTFFARLFGRDVHATNFDSSLSNISVWCTGSTSVTTDVVNSYDPDGNIENSKITIALNELLDSNTVYAVILRGGKGGISDTLGVGIKNADNASINDIWVFETGNQICKIKDVVVEPDSHIFQTPFSIEEFEVFAIGENGDQKIVSTAGYSWEWGWGPQNNPIFSIPAGEEDLSGSVIMIGATAIPGSLTAVASARITEDIDQDNNQKGQTIYGTTELTALFCENPWPGFDENNEWQPYEDGSFNFFMSYCADAGLSGNQIDDLPFLEQVFITEFDDGSPGLEVPGVPVVETVTIPGNCSIHTDQECLLNTDCPAVYNMPFAQDGVNAYTTECDFSLSLDELIANGCNLVTLPTGRFCRTSIEYPPQYGSTYRSCSTEVDCDAGESCVTASNSWKLSTSCIGVTEVEVVPDTTPGDGTDATLAEDTLLKSFFFNDRNDDVLGLQIFKNAERLSAEEWFIDKFGSAASLQQVNVAGYDGVTDGNNFYINALNKPDVENPETQVFSNIYLLGINKDAQSETRNVFEQLLNSLEFNTNFTDYGYCLSDSASADLYISPEDYVGALTCTTDFDCLDDGGGPLEGTSGVCSNVKTKFFRDWDRLHDVEAMQATLASNAPDLVAGTYIPNYTVSRWPSWNNLGGLPLDTLNTWTACGAEDQQTCWDPENFAYSCPAVASVYEYTYDTFANTYQIHIPFEYFINEAVLEQEFDEFIVDPNTFTIERSCVGQVLSPFGGQCGDGVVNPGEECDPPGSGGFVSGICPVNEFAEAVCGEGCAWEFGACQLAYQCGNGVLESGEFCDDGSLNGTYGHCAGPNSYPNSALECQDPHPQYCGNGEKDDPQEFCDWSFGQYVSSGSSAYYNRDKENSCAADCLSTGSYCGDGIIQSAEGEECDDGNNDPTDNCSPVCTLGPPACRDESVVLSRVTVDYNTVVEEDQTTINLYFDHDIEETIESCTDLSGNILCESMGLTCQQMGTYVFYNEPYLFYKTDSCNVSLPVTQLSQEDLDSTGIPGVELPVLGQFTVVCNGKYDFASTDAETPLGELACGNGTVENQQTHPGANSSEWEACDLGDQNGIACSPVYGEGCSYCSVDCQNVITVDPIAYCGNGIIDFDDINGNGQKDFGEEFLEACDALGETVYSTDYFFGATPATCEDKGKWQCLNSCTQSDNTSCVVCGITFDNTNPEPKVAFINPMIKSANPSNWPLDFGAILLREKGEGDDVSSEPLGVFYHLLDDGSVPTPENKNSFELTGGGFDSDMGIESDLLCNGEYVVAMVPSAEVGASLFLENLTKYPYAVDNETAEVYNEFVFSPGVPEGVYRAVVRWTGSDGSPNNFVGGVYTEQDQSQPNITYDLAAIPDEGTGLCSAIDQDASNYWIPAELIPDYCLKYADAVYVHPQNGLENTFIQSFTIDTSSASSDFGFYVQAVNFDRIAAYKFTDLVVELYDYHEGQTPEFSIFEPTYTFAIKDAAGTSSNPTAKYWHVFNLERDAGMYSVVPIESIETDECELKKNILDAAPGGCEI